MKNLRLINDFIMDFKRRGGQKIIIKYWALLLNKSHFNLLE